MVLFCDQRRLCGATFRRVNLSLRLSEAQRGSSLIVRTTQSLRRHAKKMCVTSKHTALWFHTHSSANPATMTLSQSLRQVGVRFAGRRNCIAPPSMYWQGAESHGTSGTNLFLCEAVRPCDENVKSMRDLPEIPPTPKTTPNPTNHHQSPPISSTHHPSI